MDFPTQIAFRVSNEAGYIASRSHHVDDGLIR
jgi:hypothetical protein